MLLLHRSHVSGHGERALQQGMVPDVPLSQRFDFRAVSFPTVPKRTVQKRTTTNFLRGWLQLSLSLKAELKGHCTEDLVSRQSQSGRDQGDGSAGKVWARQV